MEPAKKCTLKRGKKDPVNAKLSISIINSLAFTGGKIYYE